MSDTLKTNAEQSDSDVDTINFSNPTQSDSNIDATSVPNVTHSDIDVDANNFPDQEQFDGDVGEISFSHLFAGEEEDSTLVVPRHRRRRPWLIVASVLLLGVLIGGGVLFYMQRTGSSQVQYTTVAVAVGNLTQTVSASGPLAAKAEYDMNFGTAGSVAVIKVHVGEQVKAGQVLAEVNAPNLELAVQQAQLAVTNDQNTYNTAVSNGDAQATLDADNNQLQTAQLQLQTALNNLAGATMTAPGNAIVAAINGIVGQNAGSSSTTPFMVLLDTSGFTITAAVNEADIANVQVNQAVRFTTTAYPALTFRATVASVGMVGTTTSGVVSYPVTLTVNMASVGTAHLYPGMTATATITTAQRIGALLVSNSAFTFPTTALQAGVISRSALTGSAGTTGSTQSTGNRHVVLVLRNGQLVPVLITTGLTSGSFSEVLSGLNVGDQVVVSATGGAFNNVSSSTGTGAGGATRGTGTFGGGGFGGGAGGGTRSGSGG